MNVTPVPMDDINVFAEDPNTVSFVARYDSYYINYVRDHPNIRTGRILSGQYVIAYTDKADMDELLRDLGNFTVAAVPLVFGLLDRQNLEAAGIVQVSSQPYLDLHGRGVLIGMVDTGIDYTNSAFRYEDNTTKIRFLWDQSISGTPPKTFPIGTEYTSQEINLALLSDDPLQIVPSTDTVGHGTFLASVMAGRDPDEEREGAATDADLIIVKLRKASSYSIEYQLVPSTQENAYDSTDIMLGIEYILEKALELDMPVSICIAVGTNRGGHDGFTMLEEYVSYVTYRTGVCICAAAGNESQVGHHTRGKIPEEGQSQSVEMTVGENAGDIFISVVNTASDRMSMAVKSPTGEMVGPIPAKSNSVSLTKLVLERSSVQIEYYYPVEGSGGQQTYIKIFDPTPGIWTITVVGDIVLDGTFNMWLPITGFVSPSVRFLTPVPYTTIVVPATSMGVITAGGFNSSNNALYIDSSWGPTRVPLPSPDLVAPCVNVGGMYPGGYGTMTGTSVAAAITTAASALMLQWGLIEGNDKTLNTHSIIAFLIRGCIRDPNLQYPNDQWGYGRLNLLRTFNQLRDT